MKKFIYSIAALAAIVVMGSCSQDSDLTETSISQSKIDSVTVGLSINTGITVSESNSSMAKSIANVPVTRATVATRADETTTTTTVTEANTHTTTTNFAPTYPSSYTVYFVANDGTADTNSKQGDYANGTIVRTITITTNSTTGITSETPTAKDQDNKGITITSSNSDNTETYTLSSIKIPAIKYDIIVANDAEDYIPTTQNLSAGSILLSTYYNSNVYDFESSLPTASTKLYLYGKLGGKDLTSSNTTDRNISISLKNNYAAVAVAHNDFVKGVTFTNGTSDNTKDDMNYGDLTLGSWYYLYINTSSSTTVNSTINLQNIAGLKDNNSVTLNPTITAGNIYQYTINDNYTGGNWDNNNGGTTGGSGDGLTITVTPFTSNGTSDLSVY
jgi:hypothetical protein